MNRDRARTDPRPARLAVLLLGLLAAACDGYGGQILDPRDERAPVLTDLRYTWIEQAWVGTEPQGQAAVVVEWELPERWDGEVFRVYSRLSGRSSYLLAATVTSCGQGLCRYVDLNVAPGQEYDYYVASVDERRDEELATSEAWRVRTPSSQRPATPAQPTTVALDNGVFVRWTGTGAARYRIFLERIGTDSVFFEIGSSDGTGFVDTRAENGTRYGYRIAAVDTLGHTSARSELVLAVPRPDYHAELIYSLAENAPESGFRFVTSDDASPVVPGTDPSAQWRLESGESGLRIVPLNGAQVTAGTFTTALTCGPGSEADCVSVDRAPAAASFGSQAVPVAAGNTYVFRVPGAGGQTHYAKIRVQGQARDADTRTVVVFDWAYQTVPDEPSLVRG